MSELDGRTIRSRYLTYMQERGHSQVPRATLVPQDDPTTFFTGSGMQPLLPYLLGESHPKGKRLVNSQPCLRAQDIDEVGDNRHTTYFEMLGNWSLGDYFKADQLRWFFDFLIDELKLDVNRLYVTCFSGDAKHKLDKDQASAKIFQKLFKERGCSAKVVDLGSAENGATLGMQSGRIFFYDDQENWWSRGGGIAETPIGDPCGGDCEFFYDFGEAYHDRKKWGEPHPASDSGRFLEVGNAVFMQYQRTKDGFIPLKHKNVDFGGGLERLAAAVSNQPDVFQISLLKPIIEALEKFSDLSYQSHANNMRIVADHIRAVVWLASDGVRPSNKEQGYVMRRLLRRAIRFAFELGVEQDLSRRLVPVVVKIYGDDYPEIIQTQAEVIQALSKEEGVFRQTLRAGMRVFDKLSTAGKLNAADLFKLYDTYGFPLELSLEEAYRKGVKVPKDANNQVKQLMEEQRQRSRTATSGEFKGGLADDSQKSREYHTATHLMYRALKNVLGDHVIQRGSNVTPERLRFDFSHPAKMTADEIAAVEAMVNQQIDHDWPMAWREEKTKQALADGVLGAFGDKYGSAVKVYTVGDPDGDHYSREICGGPHVERTSQLGSDSRRFKITKESSSSAGVRRVKAVLISSA